MVDLLVEEVQDTVVQVQVPVPFPGVPHLAGRSQGAEGAPGQARAVAGRVEAGKKNLQFTI